ncbi:hypothetical protein TKK_0008895 [Trichogramma kaykai]
MSMYGLDKIAEQKLRQRSLELKPSIRDVSQENRKRKFCNHAEETPTYTGGIDKKAKERLDYRINRKNHDRRRANYKKDQNSRRERTPSFSVEPSTPSYYKAKDGTSKSSWDDEDEYETPRKRSTWDHSTPCSYRDVADSVRSKFTPSYEYNALAEDPK